MTTQRSFATSSRLTVCGAVFLALTLVAIARTKPADAPAPAARQRILEMFARAYFPGRTGQLMIVPREGDFITRPDPDVAYMHGSPWAYDVSIPLLFAGPAVRTGRSSMPPVQQDVAPTLPPPPAPPLPPPPTRPP